MSTAALEACALLVRRADPDRYFASLFAPAEVRPYLFALHAFNHELARIGETVHEPMMGHIRLQWWREAIEGARLGRPRRHDVVEALAELFRHHDVPADLLESMLAAREFDVSNKVFETFDALVSYLDATSGNLMRLAAIILAPEKSSNSLARDMGVAFGLTGILRALPYHAARGKLYVPKDLLEEAGATPDDITSPNDMKLAAVTALLSSRASHFYNEGRSLEQSRPALAAFLPAALIPLYLSRLAAQPRVPGTVRDVPLYRRQIALLRAALRGRV
jgi:phytoene synthase